MDEALAKADINSDTISGEQSLTELEQINKDIQAKIHKVDNLIDCLSSTHGRVFGAPENSATSRAASRIGVLGNIQDSLEALDDKIAEATMIAKSLATL